MKTQRLLLTRLLILSFLSVISGCQMLPESFRLDEPSLTSIETQRFISRANASVIGQKAVVAKYQGETLLDIARHYGLGFNEIVSANEHINVWHQGAADNVMLPLKFILPDSVVKGIVINVATMRMFYFPDDAEQKKYVYSFPLGIGKKGWSTPLGKTKIVTKTKSPNWYVPKSIRREHALKGDPLPAVVKAGPDNPLGQYAMRLGFPGYLIHGTNKPYGVGLRVSHGCVRMYPEHIEDVFPRVSVGTQVHIVDQPFLVGWQDNMLLLEVHPSFINNKKNQIQIRRKLENQFKKNKLADKGEIDWGRVEQVISQAKGQPYPVLKRAGFNSIFTNHYPRIKRPPRLQDMPVVPELNNGDWSLLVKTYSERESAEKLSAILNHQGPQIASRVYQKQNDYQVIVGPFANKKQANKVVKRIFREFEIAANLQKYSDN